MAAAASPPVLLDPAEAFARLVDALGLARPAPAQGDAGVRGVLDQLRCIQLDPLDRIGTNAELVAAARVDGLSRHQVYDALLPGHAFEHFAKERCLLPARLLPAYRERAVQAPWWRLTERLKRLPEGLVEDVYAEIVARGPVAVSDLSDRGAVEALDWSGWKGTGRAATMAVEVLWTRCRVVVCGRTPTGKVVDLPQRALPGHAERPAPADPLAELLVDRIHACGLMPEAVGPWWGGLRSARDAGLPDRLIHEGRAVRVRLTGSRRSYLASPSFVQTAPQAPDDRLRILGPLDPLIWDRKLVEHATGFRYVWEVYKPAEQREWGWYVVPLLHRGRLVGRLEAHREDDRIVVDRLWEEVPRFPRRAFDQAVARLQEALREAPVRGRAR